MIFQNICPQITEIFYPMISPPLLFLRTSTIYNFPFFLAMPKLFRIFAHKIINYTLLIINY